MEYNFDNNDRVGDKVQQLTDAQKAIKGQTKSPGMTVLRVLSDIASLGLAEIGWHQMDKKVDSMLTGGLVDQYNQGNISASDLRNISSNNGVGLTPEQDNWLQNEESAQATEEAREYDTEMRDTALKSTTEQLTELGMNPGSAISIGGMSTPSGPVQDVSKSNISETRFRRSYELCQSLLQLSGGLARAGVYGSAIYGVKRAAANAANTAANNANMLDQKYGFRTTHHKYDRNGSLIY